MRSAGVRSGFKHAAATAMFALGISCSALTACTEAPEAAQPATASSLAPVAQARGRVDVEGGIQRVIAPRDGVVDKMLVEIGDEVKAGQALAQLATKRADLSLSLTQAELDQSTARVRAQRSRLPALKERAARLREAAALGAQSGQAADDAAAAVNELEAEITVLEAATQVIRRQHDLALEALQSGTIRAPVAGRIVERHVRPADGVSANTPLYAIKPARPLVVLAELNDELIDRVKIGMRADVVPAGSESGGRPAHVIRIGEVFGPTRLGDDTQPASDVRSVECVLRLDDQTLRIGQRVRVRFFP